MKKSLHLIVISALCSLLALSGPAAAGTIRGTVNVKGLRSPQNVLIYLAKAPAVDVDLSKAKFVMDQKDLTFIPHVLPVLVGSTVHFPNRDKVNHNVFSLSRANQFNLGSYAPGENKTVLFDKPGIVELRCDVHAEMAAYIMVMKNPYWSVTDNKGQFVIPDKSSLNKAGITGIKDLHPGQYTIKAWHEKLKTVKETVTVPENGDVTIQLELIRGVPGVLFK